MHSDSFQQFAGRGPAWLSGLTATIDGAPLMCEASLVWKIYKTPQQRGQPEQSPQISKLRAFRDTRYKQTTALIINDGADAQDVGGGLALLSTVPTADAPSWVQQRQVSVEGDVPRP